MAIWLFFMSGVLILIKGDEDYHYDEDINTEIEEDDGVRLVGASKGTTKEIPFLVSWNTMDSSFSKCTGSLISPSWVLSAAHCITDLVLTEKIPECIEASETGNYNSRNIEVKCTLIEGHIKISLINPQGAAYLGIDNTLDKVHVENGVKVPIDFIIRHKKSYRAGGNYGGFGGYDITLLHLTHPAPPRIKPACLPGKFYQDSGIGPHYRGRKQANLAGYGMYVREPCLTDKNGKAKFQYCAKSMNTSMNPCHNTQIVQPPICEKFLQASYAFPNYEGEAIIFHNYRAHRCFQQTSPLVDSQGWCPVSYMVEGIGRMTTNANSWGFCSKDCYLKKPGTQTSNVLRQVANVDILDDTMCREYLDEALSYNEVEVHPKIICIGFIETLQYTVFGFRNGFFYKINQETDFNHPMSFKEGKPFFVRSAGTCNGDSGGPVFVKEGDTYVVLGAVSGGRGKLGNCGGLNNPTHYVRVKMFVDWIKLMMVSCSHSKEFEKPCVI